jgi:hypothetical protein
LTSAHQNNLKTPKNINLKKRKKIKKFSNFFKNVFEMQKQTGMKVGSIHCISRGIMPQITQPSVVI